ncbi:hypothetical protein HPB47_014781 [Ixodes persulcatus]|uniref:Uncharacterized protein n=1 Tax=Ixodes persulcatus TaxID=34615 RepID=A0AC60QV66_IXOPE|nr:hypothetical protein HPB47_014781 [Ixodes persulcatus]
MEKTSSTYAETLAIAETITIPTQPTNKILIRTDSQAACRAFRDVTLPPEIFDDLQEFLTNNIALEVTLQWLPGPPCAGVSRYDPLEDLLLKRDQRREALKAPYGVKLKPLPSPHRISFTITNPSLGDPSAPTAGDSQIPLMFYGTLTLLPPHQRPGTLVKWLTPPDPLILPYQRALVDHVQATVKRPDHQVPT